MANLARVANQRSLIEICEHLAALHEWQEKCPFETDGVYECCASEINVFEDKAKELAAETNDEALIETVNGAVDEQEYGVLEDNVPEFWRAVAVQAAEQPEAPHNE